VGRNAGDGDLTDLLRRFESASPGLTAAAGGAVGALAWSFLAAFFLYPVFQAMLWRWWASGLRFGDVTLTSRLHTGPVYGAYARFVGLSLLWSAGVGIGSTIAGLVVNAVLKPLNEDAGQIGAVAVALVAYVVLMLGYSALYQTVVRLALWRLTVETVEVTGLAALDKVTARGQPSSAFGEGLADALNVGGL
jgi:uncharacterized membrane protein YjgN (DUF898 family)